MHAAALHQTTHAQLCKLIQSHAVGLSEQSSPPSRSSSLLTRREVRALVRERHSCSIRNPELLSDSELPIQAWTSVTELARGRSQTRKLARAPSSGVSHSMALDWSRHREDHRGPGFRKALANALDTSGRVVMASYKSTCLHQPGRRAGI